MLAVTALLSVEDIYIRPRAPELMEEASKAHSRFFDRVRDPEAGHGRSNASGTNPNGMGRAGCLLSQTGDHFALVHLWHAFEASGFAPAWARDNFLHFRALKMARNIYLQLEDLLNKLVCLGPRAEGAETRWHSPETACAV